MTRRTLILPAAVLILLAPPAAAQTWTGALSGSWNTAGNWSPPTKVPASDSSTQLTFGPAAMTTAMTDDIPGTFILNAMTFSAGAPAYTLTGNTFNFQTSSASVAPVLAMNSNTAVTVGDAISIATSLTVTGTGTGTVTLNGQISSIGSLYYSGAGTLVLGGANTYFGGTSINSGTLLLANGGALPAGGNVSIAAGTTLNTGGVSNTGPTAIGTLTFTGGTFTIPTGFGDYYLNKLVMTNGVVDMTAVSNAALHFVTVNGPQPAITINAGTSNWAGAAARFENDVTPPVTVTLASGATLNVGTSLTGGGFTFAGGGAVRLSNTGNTANITASSVFLYSNDLSTNVGSGAFGTLGSGTITLASAHLVYDGATATSAKGLTLTTTGILVLQNPGTNLTITGAIGESAPGAALFVTGPIAPIGSSALTLSNANNSYTGPTTVEDLRVLAIATITNGGVNSPIGASSNAAGNLVLGVAGNSGRGDLLYTGGTASTDRGATVGGLYSNNAGGAIGVQNAGTTLTWGGQITGGGSFVKSGAGTLVVANNTNNYSGGTYIEGGTLALGSGADIPAGGNVTVNAGGTFSTAGLSNGPATAIGTLTVNGGTFRTPTFVGDYYLNQLVMTNGTVDATGTNNFALHFVNNGAGITVNAGTSNWIGSGSSRIQNDSNAALPITIFSNGRLNLGTALAGGGYTLTEGVLSLTSTGNTANITISGGILIVADVTTNGVGALGTGAITIGDPSSLLDVLQYNGPTAATAKPLSLGGFGGFIRVLNAGTNLTISGPISGTGAGPTGLIVEGSFTSTPSTLTLSGTNTYTGTTDLIGNVILAVSTIPDGGTAGPLGVSSSDPGNLDLGSGRNSYGRGTIRVTGTAPSYTTLRGISVGGLYTATYSDGFVSRGGGVIDVANAGTNLTIAGQIIDSSFEGRGSLIKAGAGTLTLTNAANSYTGGTYVEAGTLAAGAGAVIPTGTDVTVFAGGVFDPSLSVNSSLATALGTVSLTGGTLQIENLNTFGYYLKTLSFTGGAVVGTNVYSGSLNLTGTTGLISNASTITSAVTVPAAGVFSIVSDSSGPTTMQIAAGTTPSGVDLDLLVPLSRSGSNPTFVKTGAGILRLNDPNTTADLVVNQGKLRVDTFAALGTGALSLTGGTLLYGGPTASTAKAITLDSGISGVEVMPAGTTLTITTPLTGDGGLAIRGAGTLVLPAGSTYVGGTTIDGITYAATNDAVFGAPTGGISVINAGTLLYTASTSSGRTFTLDTGGTLQVAAGQTLTITSGRVNGGYLAGPGTFAVTGGTALTGVTTFGSTPISVTGPASLVNFTNGGPLTVAAGLASPVALTRFTNQGSGSITVGQDSQVNAADFQSYGTLTINPAALTQDFSQTTLMTNVGSTPLYFNGGSRTFVGTPATAVFPSNWPNVSQRGLPTFVAGLDLNGKNATVAGGLFVNNGYVEDTTNNGQGTATVIADFGSLVKGAGYFQNSVQTINGGKFQAGNSPGLASFGKFVLGPGGVSSYVFAIDDATGSAGPSPDAQGHVSGWGLVKSISHMTGSGATPGNFTWTATPADKLLVSLETLLNPTTVGVDVAGTMDHFDPTRSYAWPAVEWTGAYAGPADATILDASTNFDTSGFANPVAGTFGWGLDLADRTLMLTYSPSGVPEPGSLALASLAFGALVYQRRWIRRRPGR